MSPVPGLGTGVVHLITPVTHLDNIRVKQMVRVDSDGGTGRRLPQWMLGVRADDQIQKTNDVDDKKKDLDEELDSRTSSVAKEENSIRRPRKSVIHQQKEDLREDLCIPECEYKKRKGRKRKSRGIDVAEDAGDLEAVPAKKSKRLRKKVMDSALEERKAKLKNSDFRSDDDMELTVDDLMVIAKEYVEADENTTRKQESYGERESCSINQRTGYTTNQAEGSLNSYSESKQRLLDHKTPNPHVSTAISGGEKVDTSVKTTGDPAKDMLDLFLGPLLHKSAAIEQPKFVTADVQFSFDSKSRNQRDNDDVGEEVLVMKKKSSLKDKVAIFLD